MTRLAGLGLDVDLVVDLDRDRSRKRENVRESGRLATDEGVRDRVIGAGDVDEARAGVAIARLEGAGDGVALLEAGGRVAEAEAEEEGVGAYNRTYYEHGLLAQVRHAEKG